MGKKIRRMLKLIKEELTRSALTVLLSGLGILLAFIGRDAWAAVVTSVFPAIKKESLASALLLSLALNLVLVGYFIWSRSGIRRLKRDLEFIPQVGVWRHKKTGLHYCPSCLNRGIESLLQEKSDRFFCPQKDCTRLTHKENYRASLIA
ncbi:MAG: hypothetical protein HYV95_12910 [Opitutae bacterium]|nr:hypothetical protein [Opitutae bacterium]